MNTKILFNVGAALVGATLLGFGVKTLLKDSKKKMAEAEADRKFDEEAIQGVIDNKDVLGEGLVDELVEEATTEMNVKYFKTWFRYGILPKSMMSLGTIMLLHRVHTLHEMKSSLLGACLHGLNYIFDKLGSTKSAILMLSIGGCAIGYIEYDYRAKMKSLEVM